MGLVQVAKTLNPGKGHFTSGVRAIVIASYAQQYDGQNVNDYTLYLEGHGESSWYQENELTLIEANRGDLLKSWEDEAEKKRTQESDLKWIFSAALDLTSVSGATIQRLADDLGLGSLWGSRGEGFTLYENSRNVMLFALSYLKAHDKEGWLKRAAEYRAGKH